MSSEAAARELMLEVFEPEQMPTWMCQGQGQGQGGEGGDSSMNIKTGASTARYFQDQDAFFAKR